MKVLMINRSKMMWTGGDWVQLEQTVNELKKLGVHVDIKESMGYGWSFYAKKYDIIHTFNFNMSWNEWLKEPKYANTKYVCSMIYQPNQKVPQKQLQKRYDNLDAAIWLTEGEQNRIEEDGITSDRSKHYIIPNGIEEFWFDEPSIPTTMPYVLTVGRLSPHKGQEYVAKACYYLKTPFVSIGGQTKKQNGHVTILPDMPREDLKKFYKNCSCFVLASRDECQPMTVMEAGAQAKNIVLTNGCEWELPHIDRCDYGDILGIANAIKKAVKKPPNFPLQSMLKKMTWKATAEQVLNVYKEVLNEQE